MEPGLLGPGQYDPLLMRLDGHNFPLAAPITYRNLATLDRKLTIGDYTIDSDDLISAFITLADTAGGIGVWEMREATHEGRIWWGDLWTRGVRTLALNRETLAIDAADFPLGVLGDTLYLKGATTLDIRSWDEVTLLTTDTTHNLTAAPVNVAVAFRGTNATTRLFVPQGSNGLDAYTGSVVTHLATPKAVALARWDMKLAALDTDGNLWLSLDGTTWTQTAAFIDAAQTPTSLVVFYDRADNPALMATGSDGVYAYEPVADTFLESPLTFPHHPDNGLGAAAWRDAHYAAAGMNVYHYNLGIISELGPARNDGVPAAYRGSIVDLRAEHNALYALVRGTDESGSESVPFDTDLGDSYDDPLLVSPAKAYASLLMWTGVGWHVAWAPVETGTPPNRIVVAGAQGAYRVWWGAHGRVYTQRLPRDFHNPREGMLAGVDRFAPSGFVETPWFDGGITAHRKLASHLELLVERASATETITILYQRDFETSWTTLYVATQPGQHVVEMGPVVNGMSRGFGFSRVRFRVNMTRDPADPFSSPLLNALAFYFTKVTRRRGSWVVNIALASEGNVVEHRRGLEVKALLDDLASTEAFLLFEHMGEAKRVRIAAIPSGVDDAGPDFDAGMRVINLVEVPVRESVLVDP